MNLEQKMAQAEKKIEVLTKNISSLNGNLKQLRDLVEEAISLMDTTSAITVEHVTTLDARLNSVGEIFVERISNQWESLEVPEEIEAPDVVITVVG